MLIEIALGIGMLYVGYKLVERPINRFKWKRRLAKGVGGKNHYSRTIFD